MLEVLYGVVVILVIGLDQLSKAWIVNNFTLYEVRPVVPELFNLVYVTNTGAAFSFLADAQGPWRHWFFVVVGIVAGVGFTIAWYRTARDSFAIATAFALIVGGALGNLIDRIRYGAVVDFLDVYWKNYHWPAFNVADSCICVGAGLYILTTVLSGRRSAVY